MAGELRYHGTEIPVRLGDRVNYKTLLLRRQRLGTVCYLPEKTGRELAAETKNPEDWLIKMDDGTITGWLYSPEDVPPPKRLLFVSRSQGPVDVVTNEDLERMEAKEEGKASSMAGQLIGCLLLLSILFGLALLIQSLWRWVVSAVS